MPAVAERPPAPRAFSHVHLHGGPAPVRRFLPELTELIYHRTIDPGEVFSLNKLATTGVAGNRYNDAGMAVVGR